MLISVEKKDAIWYNKENSGIILTKLQKGKGRLNEDKGTDDFNVP